MSKKHELWHHNRWNRPLPASTLVLMSHAEMVRRIEAIRSLEPLTLPLGRLAERPVLTRRAS